MTPTIPVTQDLERLGSLVDHRTEEPDVEYKTWMDLSAPESKAKLAKHLCALSNYGGGWIIFGIENDGSHAEPHPGELGGYSQDIINGIVERYLHPAFHCTVHFAPSPKTGKLYPVVQVPPHGAQPISAKTDGPLVDKRRVGVSQGVHYIRVSGPRSVAIDNPELWRGVLHRCVLIEREGLLSSINRLFTNPATAEVTPFLGSFVDEAITTWNGLQNEEWLVDAKQNRAALAFQFLAADGGPVSIIELNRLREGIREASNAADAECPGLTSFDISLPGHMGPTVRMVDNLEGFEVNALFNADGTYLMGPSFWRALVNGVGVEMHPYHEDTDWVRGAVEQQTSREWQVGAYFSPRFQAVRIYQFIAFVRNLARFFPDVANVRLVVDCNGLSGRIIRDAKIGTYYSVDRKSSTPSRRVQIDATIESLLGDGTYKVASLLLRPLLRLFDGFEAGEQLIRSSVRDLF